MSIRIRLLIGVFITVVVCGCWEASYFRTFSCEDQAQYPTLRKGDFNGFFDCGEFAVLPFCQISRRSPRPIVDSAYEVVLFFMPIDTTEAGNQRFVAGLTVSCVVITDTSSSDTIQVFDRCVDSVEAWSSFSRKVVSCGKAPMPNHLNVIILSARVHYLDRHDLQQTRWVAFRMFRDDSKETVLKPWAAGP